MKYIDIWICKKKIYKSDKKFFFDVLIGISFIWYYDGKNLEGLYSELVVLMF